MEKIVIVLHIDSRRLGTIKVEVPAFEAGCFRNMFPKNTISELYAAYIKFT